MLELKCTCKIACWMIRSAFNRTMLELKFQNYNLHIEEKYTFNRTMLELKSKKSEQKL